MIDTDNDYYKNLSRVMKYTQGDIGLPLILLTYKSGNIKWYADVEFVVHTDTRRHTGGLTNMGTGGYYVQYSKKTEHQEFN